MIKITLHCRDSKASAESIRLECALDAQGYIVFDDGAFGTATYNGEDYEFDLDKQGIMSFGNAGGDDRYWRTDLHDLEMKLGKLIRVNTAYGPASYEIISIQ